MSRRDYQFSFIDDRQQVHRCGASDPFTVAYTMMSELSAPIMVKGLDPESKVDGFAVPADWTVQDESRHLIALLEVAQDLAFGLRDAPDAALIERLQQESQQRLLGLAQMQLTEHQFRRWA